MNIVSFWEQQIEKWNTDQKCDLCWVFSAPLTESAMNIQQLREDSKCCVQVMLLRDKVPAFSTNNTYNEYGLLIDVKCNTSFQLLVAVPTTLGINNYNEIAGHSTDESRWSTILYNIEQCLKCDALLDFCEFLGDNPRVTQWSAMQELRDKTDNNYAGYRLTATFQEIR